MERENKSGTSTSQKRKQLFGTNGVRGVIGKDMTPELVFTIGRSLGDMRKGHLAVGRDTRTSGEVLINAVKAGILASGCEVVDCGILPTPALQYIIREHFDGGAMITASHNPPEYNGVKIIEPDGTEMDDEETIKLEHVIFSRSHETVEWHEVLPETYAPHLIDEYVTAIVDHFPEKPGKGITVVVDPGSGPACLTTASILREMGCRVLTVNGVMDGTFPGRLPEPTVEGLEVLSELVKQSGAAFGVAHDGDADRAVFVDEEGTFVEENAEFALIAQTMCTKRGVIVTPVSTSKIVELIAKNHDCSVVYTPVGSIYVARTMRSLIEKRSDVIFGGEGNGGLIFPCHQFCRDGGMTAAMMVKILASEKVSLSRLIKQLPERHMIKDKIRTTEGEKVLRMLRSVYAGAKTDETDGLKIFRDDSWALVRASGTEPIVRIIIDSPNIAESRIFYQELMEHILLIGKTS
ncbi:MAG: Phosphoglucomutase/phosphomannomutase [Methanoregula sp. SKADARSKE-2]|nr:MAG: Phosphoglucomutase/phosphomannomutase [Methanoregula sp. SKADARSKE-2]